MRYTPLQNVLTSIDPEYLSYLRRKVRSDDRLWLIRAVIGEDLPEPMNFERLISYAKSTGKGEFSPRDLERIFYEQMELV